MTLTYTRMLAGAALAASLAVAAACSGTSPSMSPTAPTASASSASGANFSPNPFTCDRPAPWSQNPDTNVGGCVCLAPNIFNPTADTCTPPPPPPTGTEGCTPGYWKGNAKKGAGNWPAPYTPLTTVNSVFDNTGQPAGDTLLDALQYGGGDDVAGAKLILLRAGAAALLNAQSSGVDYALTAANVINSVNVALGTNDRTTIIAQAGILDGLNNGGCPLDNSGK